jgi:uncharacterized membrane protein
MKNVLLVTRFILCTYLNPVILFMGYLGYLACGDLYGADVRPQDYFLYHAWIALCTLVILGYWVGLVREHTQHRKHYPSKRAWRIALLRYHWLV